jgi:hypothetical protein
MYKYVLIQIYQYSHGALEYIPVACFDSVEASEKYRDSLGLNTSNSLLYGCEYIPRPSIWQKLKNYFGQRK